MDNWAALDHLNIRQVQYSDPHCIIDGFTKETLVKHTFFTTYLGSFHCFSSLLWSISFSSYFSSRDYYFLGVIF